MGRVLARKKLILSYTQRGPIGVGLRRFHHLVSRQATETFTLNLQEPLHLQFPSILPGKVPSLYRERINPRDSIEDLSEASF